MNKNFISESGSVGQPASETLVDDMLYTVELDGDKVLVVTKADIDNHGRFIAKKGVVVTKDWWDQQSPNRVRT